MRNSAPLLLGLILLGGVIWIGLKGTRRMDPVPPASVAEEEVARPPTELAPVITVGDDEAEGTLRSSSPTTARIGAPLRASIRGRVVMEDTLEPLEQVLSIRLRTADLRQVDSVETQPDGSFSSKRTFADGGVLARVCTAEGRELVDHEARFDPSSTEPWLVLVPGSEFPTLVHGRVIDLAGEPVSDAVVYCTRLPRTGAAAPSGEAPEEPWVAGTDEDGAFTIPDLVPGTYELQPVGRHARGSAQTLAIPRGETDAGALVLPSPGTVSGRLVAEGEPRAYFLVRELATGRELSVREAPSHDDSADGVHRFRIAGLAAGEYELSLLPLDGRDYEPASLRMSPPASGLEFRAVSRARSVELSVRDSVSEELLNHEVFTRLRGRWLDGFHAQGERWLVWAERHKPASLEPSMLPAGEPPARWTVQLDPGFGELRLYQTCDVDPATDTAGKWSRPPLSGVQVRADGTTVATSDLDGIAVVSLPRAPADIDEWLAGWSTRSSYRRPGIVVVIMTKE